MVLLGVPVIGYFTDESDPRLIKFADAANHLREEFQFHHVYGADVKAFGGKVGTLRVVQPPHFQSKYENKVKTPFFNWVQTRVSRPKES